MTIGQDLAGFAHNAITAPANGSHLVAPMTEGQVKASSAYVMKAVVAGMLFAAAVGSMAIWTVAAASYIATR